MITELYNHFLKYPSICTDTRRLKAGDIFWALKGDNFDGNLFVIQALEKGASAVVTQLEEFAEEPAVFYVEDTLKALQEMALYHRKKFTIPILAICGSNGKTTTKELTHRILSTKYRTLSTEGNLNNHIGIPLTLLKLHRTHEIAVIEMGANHQREIAEYCTWVLPTHGLTTNIGKSHLEGFGGLEGVAEGEGELFEYLYAQKGFAFVNQDDPFLQVRGEKIKPKLTYGIYQPAEIKASAYTNEEGKVGINIVSIQKALNYTQLNSQIYGIYNGENVLAASCIGIHFEVKEAAIRQAIAQYIPENNRSQVKVYKDYIFVMDAYNANPSSMQVALKALSVQNTNKHKVAILGDMYELGTESEAEHETMGIFCNSLAVERIIFVGKMMQKAYQRCLIPEKFYFENTENHLSEIIAHIPAQSMVLFKASRAMKLEKIWENLIKQD